MPVTAEELRTLPPAEKLRLIEFLWDDLGDSTASIPPPAWVAEEIATRRRDLNDPTVGLTHDEVWRRIAARRG